MSTATATPAERLGTPAGRSGATVDVRLVPALAPPPAAAPRSRTAASRSRTAASAGVVPAPAPPGASAPVVERLGASRIASYQHRAPEEAPARPRATPGLPPGTVAGVAAHLDPRQACCMVALAAVEVLAGRRPIAQLARWLTPDVYDALARRAALTAPGSPAVVGPATGGPVPGTARRGETPTAASRRGGTPTVPARRASVRRVRLCRVDVHVVESSVVVAHGDRVRAVAVRLTRASGWWRASALVVG